MTDYLVKTIHYKSYPAVDPTQQALSQKNKNVLVTGGGSGIGAEISRSFAKAGASNIAITGRTKTSLEKTATQLQKDFPATKLHVYATDVVDFAAVNQVFKEFTSSVGPIDVLVNNAGYYSEAQPLGAADFEEWYKSYDINVKGAAIVIQAFLKTKPEGRKGTIITLNTAMAWAFTFPGGSSYGPSKLATLRFSEVLAVEHPELTVVNASPGVVRTAMAEKAGGDKFGFPITEIDLPANTMVWLSTPEAAFLSGRSIEVNWDVTELKAGEKEIVDSGLFKVALTGWKERVFPQYG